MTGDTRIAPARDPASPVPPSRGEFAVALLAIALCTLHLLRNVSLVFPLAYFALATMLLAYGLRRFRATGAQLLILACYAYVVLLTVYHSQDFGDPGIGIARLLYLLPLVLYLFGARFDDRQALMVWALLGAFVLVAALSIFFQQFFGAISWFADASERAGTTRFASLAGSLTAFGSIVGPACFLALLLVRRPVVRLALVVLLLSAAVLSLQKAAIAGALLGLALGFFATAKRVDPKLVARAGLTSLLVGGLAAYALQAWLPPEVQEALQVFLRGTLGEEGSGDVSILESVRARFVDWPLASVEFHGIDALLFGVGAYGASGALGYPDLPMMHNLPGEVLVVAGAAIFFVFVLTSILALARAVRWLGIRDDGAVRPKAAAGVFLLTFIVGLNTGSLHFHPVIGLFYWVSLRELTAGARRWNALRQHARRP